MEEATSKHEDTNPDAEDPPVEPEGNGQGGGATSSIALLNGVISAPAIRHVHEQNSKSAVPAEHRESRTMSPRLSSGSPRKRSTASDNDGLVVGSSEPVRHPANHAGALPPLNLRGDPGADPSANQPSPNGRRLVNAAKDSKDGQLRTRGISLRSAAVAVATAATLRDYRRNTAAMHIDLLRVFVPDILINYLENASKPLESQAFFVKAACMCADISGFTALSEKHCKKGTAGLDTLIINSYYSNLVNIVYSFGGDIIKIAGDALYCVFMPDEHDLRGAVLCAALCSMQLREVAADGLTLHVGISCGELCFGILGGIDNYWECLMSGVPIGLVAEALDEAKKQEVVVSVECMSIIGDCCRGTPLPSRNVLLHTLEPPRREKRGSVRMANMIANKGLPVELEPTEGLFPEAADADTAAAAAAAAARLGAGTGQGEAKRATPEGSSPQPQSPTSSVGSVAATATSAGEDASAGGRKVGGARGAGGAVDANAAWVSSNAKARERKAGTKLLGDDSVHALGAAGKMRVEVSSAVLPVLQGFVPGPVTDLLAAGIFMYMAEMRTVTTLFVKLDSYSPEKHKNLLSLQIHLTTIQKILAEHEGFLRQFLVDDKGCVLIACWGVPGRSYPDNGNRCLAAAVEIHASLQVRDMKTSMGITTGHALCGRMGGKIRSEYAMVGDVINLAARLMGKAKGRIVCDEVTHDLVCYNETMVALFKRLDPMMLKGKEHPIAPFVCLAQQGSDMWETHKQLRMIGRINLQNSVNAFLDLIDKGDNITNPEPTVVVIEGAHGTGKASPSMVADRVKKSASQFFRRKVHMYAMVQMQSGTPYAGAKGMLRTIFGLDHLGDDALAIKQALLKIVREVYGSAEQPTTDVAIRALKAVLGVDLGGETEGEILQAVRRSSVGGRLPLHVVHSVISELATHALGNLPAVFILDNVHLMDKMSWKLLIQLLYCPLRLLLVLTATPVEEDIQKKKNLFHAKKKGQITSPTAKAERASEGPNFVWHGDHGETHLHMQQYIRATQLPITTKFSLSPFSKEELRQLLQHTLAPRDRAGITEPLVDTVYSLSGGNPYWCVEVVRFIKENSVGIFMSRIAVQEAGGGGEDSGTVNGSAVSSPEEAMMGRMGILVVCRFERLLVEEQSVVRYASVAGLEFSMDLLLAVLPRNIRPQLDLIIQARERCSSALVTARFVVYSRHTYYKFRNSMVHMVLYNLTPASSRKRMHKAVAQHYTMSHGQDPLYLPVMTYHLLQARVDPKQAVTFVCRTAAHALVALCYEDCMEALEKAIEFVSCTSDIHAVMFVHHYISTMHEMGHTMLRNGSLGAGGSQTEGEGEGDPNARNRETTTAKETDSGRTQGPRRRASSGAKDNSSGGTIGSSQGGIEGRVQGRIKPAQESSSGRQGVSEEPRAGRPGPGQGGAMTGHGSFELLPEESERRMSDVGSSVSVVATGAHTQALGSRISRLKKLLKEPHARLCSAGQFCPTLQDVFPSPRRQAADDDYADSMLKHSASMSPRSPKNTFSGSGGASDFFEEPVETGRTDMIMDETLSWLAGGNNNDEGGEDDENDDDGHNTAGGNPARPVGNVSRTHSNLDEEDELRGRCLSSSKPYTDLPSDGRRSGALTSVGWEVAHLLHVCLGRYLQPGGPSPGGPETADGSFSISMHRLPPEAGDGAELPGQESDDDGISRRISHDETNMARYGPRTGHPGAAGMRKIRSKVSSAKLLLAEHGPGRKSHHSVAINSAASVLRSCFTRQVSKAMSEFSGASPRSNSTQRGGSTSGDYRSAGPTKLAPMPARKSHGAHSAEAASAMGRGGEINRTKSSSGGGPAGAGVAAVHQRDSPAPVGRGGLGVAVSGRDGDKGSPSQRQQQVDDGV
ncbi:unnamed protein product, partial [Ectocarpus sp. 8 AP-2014]